MRGEMLMLLDRLRYELQAGSTPAARSGNAARPAPRNQPGQRRPGSSPASSPVGAPAGALAGDGPIAVPARSGQGHA